MTNLERFYNERIKFTKPFRDLTEQNKSDLANTLNFALYNLHLSANNFVDEIKKISVCLRKKN